MCSWLTSREPSPPLAGSRTPTCLSALWAQPQQHRWFAGFVFPLQHLQLKHNSKLRMCHTQSMRAYQWSASHILSTFTSLSLLFVFSIYVSVLFSFSYSLTSQWLSERSDRASVQHCLYAYLSSSRTSSTRLTEESIWGKRERRES